MKSIIKPSIYLVCTLMISNIRGIADSDISIIVIVIGFVHRFTYPVDSKGVFYVVLFNVSD